MHLAGDVAPLADGEVAVRPYGTTHCILPQQKLDALRGLLTRSLPAPRPGGARPGGEPDVAHSLVRLLLEDLSRCSLSA